MDGVTLQEYEKNLEANLANLVERLKRKRYHARLVRRRYIPKGNGKLRPLGIPVLEDKLLQCAVAQILHGNMRGGLSAVQLWLIDRSAGRIMRCAS